MEVAPHGVVDHGDVEAELTGVAGFERAGLELDDDVAQLLDVEEEQIDGEVGAVDIEMDLAPDEGEASAELAEGVDNPVEEGLLEVAFGDLAGESEKSKT